MTQRCWTYIWGTQVHYRGGQFFQTTGWVFNNLTYVASPRSLWAGNPLARTGSWTDDQGRLWRTECNTPVSGGNGCRSYITTRVPVRVGNGYQVVRTERFNNIVRFS